MSTVQNDDLLLINRAGVDYKVEASELISSGDAATITVGTTTTGAPGTNASVSNSGTTSDAIFDFTIPRGDKGEKGDKGDKGDDGTSLISIKGNICLNDASIPLNPANGDGYVNDCSGTSNAAWEPGIPTGTPHNDGDVVVYNSTQDEWILLSLSSGGPSDGTGVEGIIGYWKRDSSNLFPVNTGDNVKIGGTLPSAPNITLNANGTSEFALDSVVNGITVGLGAGSVSTNTALGTNALQNNSTGNTNTATGFEALRFNTTGNGNVANGYYALSKNIDGDNNTASGSNSLYSNTTGNFNTANGSRALYSNTIGRENTAVGLQSLTANVDGNSNVAIGTYALYSNVTGTGNTANGHRALFFSKGSFNTATGSNALTNNDTGGSNTAFGRNTLILNTVGNGNTAQGNEALQGNISGNYNTANGNNALSNCETGSGNIGVGFLNNVGAYSPVFNVVTEDNRIVLGHTAITDAYVKVAWTVTSDERDKTNFAPIPYGLDFVNQLKPTQYEFRVDRDSEETSGPIRYGFKAQDILALEGDDPVIIDTEDPNHLKLKTDALVPVLVNAIKEQQAIIEALNQRLTDAGI